MRVVEFDTLDIPLDYFLSSGEQERIVAELLKRHGQRGNWAYLNMLGAMARLPRVLSAVKGEIRGKVVMDLGSGATDGYEPWLCRALHVLGAYPVAVDLGSFEGEDFECHSLDFSDPENLQIFPDGYADVATFINVSTSYEWRERRGRVPFYQFNRIVKSEGSFLYER